MSKSRERIEKIRAALKIILGELREINDESSIGDEELKALLVLLSPANDVIDSSRTLLSLMSLGESVPRDFLSYYINEALSVFNRGGPSLEEWLGTLHVSHKKIHKRKVGERHFMEGGLNGWDTSHCPQTHDFLLDEEAMRRLHRSWEETTEE